MLFYNEYLQPAANINKLGFPASNPQYIPQEYLNQGFFVIWRTCHTFGDWVIVSAMPRLIKEKYPHSTIAIPSPECLATRYDERQWMFKHDKPFNNVYEVYLNNPYVDGMIDNVDGIPLYHDHFRIYDESEYDVPLTEQMLKFWRFDPNIIKDSSPELYWSNEEKQQGDDIIKKIFDDKPFGFLYIDEFIFEVLDESKLDDTTEKLSVKRNLIQKKINQIDNLPWLYYAKKDISETPYIVKTKTVDVRSLNVSLRVQNYIKSKSKVIIGHQGGYGTDCMSRYTDCYVVPLGSKQLNEHFIRTTKYLIYERR